MKKKQTFFFDWRQAKEKHVGNFAKKRTRFICILGKRKPHYPNMFKGEKTIQLQALVGNHEKLEV